MRSYLLALAVLAAAPAQAITFTATMLQTPEGVAMQGFGINNHGDVVGGSGDGSTYQAYLRTAAGSYQALGGFGGTRSTATAIAENGIIAGQARTGATGATSIPFIRFGEGPLTPIALPAGESAVATGVNAAGIVAGRFNTRDANNRIMTQGFRWSQAQGLEVLSSAAGVSSLAINGLNDAGVAVGTALGRAASPFRWEADGSVTLLERLSGVPNDFYNDGYANAISDSGLTAGSVSASGIGSDGGFVDTNLFAIWGSDGKLLRTAAIDTYFGGDLTAINVFGDAVGSVAHTVFDPVTGIGTDEGHAVLWLADKGPVDLGQLIAGGPLDLRGAFGINDSRQIVAWGLANGVRFDVLLTPVTDAVPEPSSWALMILGFGIAGAASRRRPRRAAASGHQARFR
ncbi:PEPxxWA-CTERM sorting domain-containing protein [Sphingomonas tabacisoli]|uniref:PEPxxWA-CTERM sorting domain-containing protein n=1 Tax=Sphingomonas tabacisoli TaxID=2249466 RepID=A0ABW4I0M9_9SPHN